VKASFAVAAHFQCKGSWADRLLVAEGDDWRVPHQDELASLTENPPEAESAFLFSIPVHMRTRFWAMLDEEAAAGSGNFVGFSDELAEFLTFKSLAPPKDSVCELLVQDVNGTVATGDIWALINFGEEPVLLAWAQLQLRLNPGEGLKSAPGRPPDVVPPSNDDPNVLVVIRFGAA
jgi:hypothetical protein